MILVNILYSGLGGHSSVVFSLIEADERREFDHIIIFYGIEDMPQSNIDKCKLLGIRYFLVKKKQGLDLLSQKRVNDILRKVKPDIILLHSVNLILPVYKFTIGTKTRLITIEHQPNHLKSKREWIWSVLLMLLSKKVVYLTDLYAEQMKGYLKLLYIPAKVSVINNGINTELFKPSPSHINSDIIIGMLARLTPPKEHITLLEAFRTLIDRDPNYKNFKLEIAGDGTSRASIESKITELGLSDSVTLTGMITENRSHIFLNRLTLYVHASLGETMSTSIMQAMACGKAIIGTDVQGINNMIIPGETGMLVQAKNKKDLADMMEKLLTDHELRNKLGKNALQYAQEHFSNNTMFKRYKSVFLINLVVDIVSVL
ncbi:MAG: glycosyltransferase family 4 protein [Ferruginibacter sp.]